MRKFVEPCFDPYTFTGWNSVLQQRLKTVSQRKLLSDIYDSLEKYIEIKNYN